MKQKLHLSFITLIILLLIGTTSYSSSPPLAISYLDLNKSSNNIVLSWEDITKNIYGITTDVVAYNIFRGIIPDFIPDIDSGSNRIAQTSTTSYIDNNSILSNDNYYYYVTAVTDSETELFLLSNIGYKIRIPLTYEQTSSNKHWLSLPYNNNYSTANDIGSDAPNISHVIRWNATTQSEEVWNQQTGTGINFPILPGESYAIVISADTVLNIVGSDSPMNFNLTYNPGNFNTNWISLPFPNAYGSASLLAEDIPNSSKVGRYDSANSTFKSWFLLDGIWMGDDFPLVPGEGILCVINDDVIWSPSTGRPEVEAIADVADGLNLVPVNLSGNAQDKNGSIANYQWDYEGDGVFDFEDTVSPDTSTSYSIAGVYHPTLLVTDNDGFRAYDYITVEVYSLENQISIDDFNPFNSDTTQFDYTLSNDGTISINLYDETDTLIRTLVDGQTMTAGSHSAVWDGRSQAGDIVSDGVYYVVFEYEIAGKTYSYTYDLRSSTGGTDVTNQITDVVISEILSPLEGQYVNIQYTLPEKSLVTIDIKNQTGTVIRHLLASVPRGAGQHIDIWEGADDTGQIVHPGTVFYVTIAAVSLADNAIIAGGFAPSLSNVSASPLRFSPATNPYGTQDNRTVVASFESNKAVTVTANVSNSTGTVVRTIMETISQAGTGQIAWNGRSDTGILQSDGLYNIKLQAEDANGLFSDIFNIQVEIFY